MTIRHLKTFIKVCELGSISKTAEELCVAQPSVSQTIIELEKYYNITLFNRANRKLTLTKEGEILLAKAKEVVASFNDFEELTRKIDTKPDIYIGASTIFGEIVLPSLLKIIQDAMPDTDPRLYIQKPDIICEKIISGDLDFGIIGGFLNNPNIKADLVGKDRLVAVASYKYKAPDNLKLEELVKYDLLIREKGSSTRLIIDYRLAQRGVNIVEPRLESASNKVILELAMSHMGIAILPLETVKTYLNSNVLREIKLDTPLVRNLYMIKHINKRLTTVKKKAYQICYKFLTEKSFDE